MYRMMFNAGFKSEDDLLYVKTRKNIGRKLSAAMQEPELVTEKAGIDDILDAQRNGEITETNILHMIENVNSAGTETLLWSIEWALEELVNNLDIQTHIRDELDQILGNGKLICEPDTHNNKLPYLMAFVKEVMRFHMCIPQLVPP